MVDKVVDKVVDKEDSTQAAMEVKEGREDIILDKVEALEAKEVTVQEVVATKGDTGDKEGKEATTLVTMDSGAMVDMEDKEDRGDKEDREDREDIIQMGMGTKEEAREVTIQEEVVTMMEKGEMVTIQANLMRRGILEKRSIGRLSALLSELLQWW